MKTAGTPAITFVSLLAAALAVPACKGKDEAADKPAAPSASTPTAAKAAPTPPPAAPTPTPSDVDTDPAAGDEDGDYIRIKAEHAPSKPGDPVAVKVEKFEVVSASFDAAKPEASKVELRLDLASIRSDSDKRDTHLKSPDYLDVGKHATATIKVSDVKRAAPGADPVGRYTAKAEITARGKTVTWPVEFEVVEAKDDSVRVKANHTFNRTDLAIGKAAAAGDSVADKVTVEMALTLKKSA
jgi:polyisoprenoid-binding protein YceI